MYNKVKFEKATQGLKDKMDAFLKKINEDVLSCEEAFDQLKDIIDELDSLEVYKAVLLDDLKEKHEEYLTMKNALNKFKAHKFLKNMGDVSEDINRLLKPNEVEEKAKATVTRNTVKKNLNRRYEELQDELRYLQDRNAKGELTSEQLTRYYLIPEVLKEFDEISL